MQTLAQKHSVRGDYKGKNHRNGNLRKKNEKKKKTEKMYREKQKNLTKLILDTKAKKLRDCGQDKRKTGQKPSAGHFIPRLT